MKKLFSKQYTKAICLLLCLMLLAELIPSHIFANRSTVSAEDLSPALEATSILYEVEEERSEYTKVYYLNNGNYLAVSGNDPIHYYDDSEEKWENIDNTLVSQTDENGEKVLTNRANDFFVSLPETLSGEAPVTVRKGELQISFQLLHTKSTARSKLHNKEAITLKESEETDKIEATKIKLQKAKVPASASVSEQAYALVQADQNSAELSYSSALDNTDITYDLSGTRLKESIVIKRRPSSALRYTYRIQADKLTAVLREDNSIDFVYPVSGKVIFTMPAPYLLDRNAKRSEEVAVSLKEQEEGMVLVTYTPSLSWLQESDTQYPVVLDPTIEGRTNIQDTYIDSSGGSFSQTTIPTISVNKSSPESTGYIRMTTLPSLPAGAVVTGAFLNLYHSGGTSEVPVEVHRVTNEYSQASGSLTFSTRPGEESKPLDVQKSQLNDWTKFDITRAMADWVTNGNNFGVSIQSKINSGYVYFTSMEGYPTENRPYFTIEYATARGADDRYTYHTQDIGRAGTAYVNDFTGNLFMQRQDLSVDGNRMSVDLTMNYETGKGWNWTYEISQSLMVYAGAPALTYQTEQGKVIYFTDPVWENGVFKAKDKEELGYEYTGYGSETISTYCDLKTPNGLVYRYSYGSLQWISNKNNPTEDRITITRQNGSANTRITQITDAVGRKYDFTYTTAMAKGETEYLQSVQYCGNGYAALQTVSYTYTSGRLSSVLYSDGLSVSYSYDTYGNILAAYDVDNYRMTYGYTTGSSRRVSSITEYAGPGSYLGESVTIAYDLYKTTYTDHKGNKNELRFDRFGNTVSDNVNGESTVHYLYDGSKRNSLLGSSGVKQTTVNYLKNSSFEKGSTGYTGTLVSGASAPSAYYSSASGRSGNASYFISTNGSTTYSLSQTTDIFTWKANDAYTFFAYVRNSSVSGVTCRAKVKVSKYSITCK